MASGNVYFHTPGMVEGQGTHGAVQGLLLRVAGSHVSLQVALLCGPVGAALDRTVEGFLPGVGTEVGLEISPPAPDHPPTLATLLDLRKTKTMDLVISLWS